MLETTLQWEREDLKKEREDNWKEKQTWQKLETTIVDTIERIHQSSGIVASQLLSQSGLDDQAAAYFQAYNFKETADSILNERPGTSQLPSSNKSTDVSGDASATISGQQVLSQSRPVGQQGKSIEQRERRVTVPKPTVDALKRKLVRPTLEQSEEPAADVEMSEVEGLTTAEKRKQGESNEQEIQESISLCAQEIQEAQGYNTKEPAQLEAILTGVNDNADTKSEFDASRETMSEPKEMTALLDDVPIVEGQDGQQSAVEVEDDREGELGPETPEQQIEGGESEEIQPELNSGEVTAVGGDTAEMGGGLEIESSDALNEDKNDSVEDAADASEKLGDQGNDNDPEQSTLATLGSPECSPNVLVESVRNSDL